MLTKTLPILALLAIIVTACSGPQAASSPRVADPSPAVAATAVAATDRAVATTTHLLAGQPASGQLHGVTVSGAFAVAFAVSASGTLTTTAPPPPWSRGSGVTQDLGLLPAGQALDLVMTARLGDEQQMPSLDGAAATSATPVDVRWSLVTSDGTEIVEAGVMTFVASDAAWLP